MNFKRLLAFLGLNFCLSLLLGAGYLFFAGSHPLALGWGAAALVSNTGMLYACLLLLAGPGFRFPAGRAFAGTLLTVFQLWLATDLAVYKIFKFHMNSMVANLVLTPGGLDSLDQGWGTKLLFLAALAGFAAAQWYFLRLSERLAPAFTARRSLAGLAALLLLAAAEKSVFAWGTLYDNAYLTRNSQLLPLYQPLRIRSFAVKYLGVKLDAEVKGGIDARYSGLNYPAAPLGAARPARPFNFLFIVVDSLRADMLNPEVMPEVSAFGRKAAVFGNHYSGGNCTRFGVFSMLYGLYGNYWFPMLGERKGPALLALLKEQGYDLRAYASAKLSFPEFNKTCFVDVPRENVYDEPAGANGALRDGDISGKFISYLKARDPRKPYFAFVFYDASHGNYDSLPGLEKFQPASPISQLALNKGNVGLLFNRYRNSIHADDKLAGDILKAVAGTGGLKDTVVIVLGDHGEAFLERGRYGHNQGFSPEEVRVPLVFYAPGRRPERISRLTSHMDIVPTLMALAGAGNPPGDYSGGRDLFDAGPRDFAAAFSWDSAGLMTGAGTLEMPLEVYKGGVKVFDAEYGELRGRKAAEPWTPLILRFQREAKKFLK